MQVFKSSFSRGMFVSTIVCCLILFYFIGHAVFHLSMLNWSLSEGMSYWLLLVVLLAGLLYAFCAQIVSVVITDDKIMIQKRWGKIEIRRADIVRVGVKSKMLFDLRLCGIGGLFGYIGLFYNSNLGTYSACANNGNRLLVISTTSKTYVVSCDQHKEVLEIIEKGTNKERG